MLTTEKARIFQLQKPLSMTPFETHPAFYNRPIRLSAEEKAAPLEVLQDFFQTCPLATLRRLLWQTVEAALALPHSVYDEATERQHLLWLYRELETALEAAALLCEKENTK